MTRYGIEIAYDGTGYAGWQIQPNGMTVQQRLQEVIAQLTGERPIVHGSGRTDQGVHARRQVAHFELERPKMAHALEQGMNALLPKDIRVLKTRRVHAAFHARRSASEKEYRYFIWNAAIVPPPLRHFRTHVRRPLDVPGMREAAGYLLGRHDFAAFSANSKQILPSTVRTLFQLDVRKHGAEIVIIARGDGFLYKMVRSLAGFLIRVGQGNATASMAREILHSRKRTSFVRTAAPEGLFLWQVKYPRDLLRPGPKMTPKMHSAS